MSMRERNVSTESTTHTFRKYKSFTLVATKLKKSTTTIWGTFRKTFRRVEIDETKNEEKGAYQVRKVNQNAKHARVNIYGNIFRLRSYRICVLGGRGVGKTEFIKYQVTSTGGVFENLTEANVKFGHPALVRLEDNNQVVAHITEPNVDDDELLAEIIKNADGFMIMFDITQPNALDDINKYRMAIFENKTQICYAVVLVGNKMDQFQKRKVDQNEAKKLARDFLIDSGVPLFEMSAKYGMNVEQCLQSMIKEIEKCRSIVSQADKKKKKWKMKIDSRFKSEAENCSE